MSRLEVPLQYRTLRATGDTVLWAEMVVSLKTTNGPDLYQIQEGDPSLFTITDRDWRPADAARSSRASAEGSTGDMRYLAVAGIAIVPPTRARDARREKMITAAASASVALP